MFVPPDCWGDQGRNLTQLCQLLLAKRLRGQAFVSKELVDFQLGFAHLPVCVLLGLSHLPYVVGKAVNKLFGLQR